MTTRVESREHDGAIVEARFFGRRGPSDEETVLASAQWRAGHLHGVVTWQVDAHVNFSRPVMELGGWALTCEELFAPRRLSGTVRIEAEYVEGRRVRVRAFDARGAELSPPPPVADWGQATTEAGLDGYIARGRLARDLAAFYPDADLTTELDEDAGRARELFSARLPEPHRSAALALDRLVRRGAVPALFTCDPAGYGLDCAKHALPGASDPRWFGLSRDASGDRALLDLETGRVLVHTAHDGRLDMARAFGSLDGWAFAMLRVELVRDARASRDEVVATFERLGLEAGVDAIRRCT